LGAIPTAFNGADKALPVSIKLKDKTNKCLNKHFI
jgi:hypothetical protein